MYAVKEVRSGNILVEENPVVYRWWFKQSAVKKLLKKLNKYIIWDDLCEQNIHGQNYVLLYVGKGNSGKGRLVDYHILDKNNFHKTGILNGRISSLRASVCGLLDIPMSTGRAFIDSYFDNNCYVEWSVIKTDLKDAETKDLKSKYLPLNDHHLKSVHAKTHRKILRECKKKMRK